MNKWERKEWRRVEMKLHCFRLTGYTSQWTPEILSPAGWYDASDEKNFINEDGALVWLDKSGKDNHLVEVEK